jgi:hypothetical protein
MVAFYPREGDLPGLADLGVESKIERLRRESTPVFWFGIVAAAVFFQFSPILTVHRPWPAALLTDEQLDAHAHKLATYPVYLVRQLVVLIKLMAGIFWGESLEVRARMALAAYGDDPSTRRTEPRPVLPEPPPRAPAPSLVQLGVREVARGRLDGAHETATGKVA